MVLGIYWGSLNIFQHIRGGAKYVTDRGIDMYVTIGNKPEKLYDLLEGKEVGTFFKAQ